MIWQNKLGILKSVPASSCRTVGKTKIAQITGLNSPQNLILQRFSVENSTLLDIFYYCFIIIVFV